jgi:Flp pilus assembly protein TadD
MSGSTEGAIAAARRIVEASPQDVTAHIELGDLLRKQNDIDGARAALRAALEVDARSVRALRALARVERIARDWTAAEQHLRAAQAVKPGNDKVTLELAEVLLRQVRFEEAADLLRAALEGNPGHASFHSRLGYILRWKGANAEAEPHLRRAIELDPTDAAAMIEMAMIFEELGDFEPALDWHRRAVEVAGPRHAPTSFCSALLAAGRSGREAWGMNRNRIEYEAFAALPAARLWQGEPLAGKSIFVITEGGPGDQIRDACCFHELARQAARVTVTIEPRLLALYQCSFPTVRFLAVPRQERVAPYDRMLSRLIDPVALNEMEKHDYATLSPELLYFFREANEQWGRQRSYLAPAPSMISKWRNRLDALGPGPKIGISWRSERHVFNRVFYHTELIDWAPILGQRGAHFVNLQYNECEDELRDADKKFRIKIVRWPDLDLRNAFDEMAGLVFNLDMVLAPNTAILEFAGALGRPALYMNRVPIAYDHWRMKDASGQDRLYPSVTQVRGARPYDTPALIDAVAKMLWSRVRPAEPRGLLARLRALWQ